jgi:hypothetical protein
MDGAEYVVTAEVWRYPSEAGWHFVTLPDPIADELRARYSGRHRPFGSLPVRATLGDSTWTTSLFADRRSGSYLLPLKRGIRARERIECGERITVTLSPED